MSRFRNKFLNALTRLMEALSIGVPVAQGMGSPRFRIRPMTTKDLDAVAAIEARLHPAMPWPRRAFAYELERPFSHSWVAEWLGGRSPRVVGYIVVWEEGEMLHIANISVHPDYQGRGIGSALMHRAFLRARLQGFSGLTLEVRATNERAWRWYQRLGFRVVRRLPGFYRHRNGTLEDGLRMELWLKGGNDGPSAG